MSYHEKVNSATSLMNKSIPIIPIISEVRFGQIKDSKEPHPKGGRFLFVISFLDVHHFLLQKDFYFQNGRKSVSNYSVGKQYLDIYMHQRSNVTKLPNKSVAWEQFKTSSGKQ